MKVITIYYIGPCRVTHAVIDIHLIQVLPINNKQRGPAVGWDIQEERLNFASHQSLALLAGTFLISSSLHFPTIACVPR